MMLAHCEGLPIPNDSECVSGIAWKGPSDFNGIIHTKWDGEQFKWVYDPFQEMMLAMPLPFSLSLNVNRP